ncbi:MAG: VTC domain-containing protein [Actinomycetia bacterium]|nr:VTC domain-containing protein [Actinomycetes bacterium]
MAAHLHLAGHLNGGPPLPTRVEQKFFISPAQMSFVFALVRRTCRWDDDYPEEQINSVYFDTADLDQHERSLSGEFTKDKVRIRWYGIHRGRVEAGPPAGPERPGAATIPVWIELKSRRGFASTKQRRRHEVPAEALVFEALRKGIVPTDMLAKTMAEFGFFPSRRLLPVIVISYRRCRFVEPRTGFRVAVDSHIRSSMILPGHGHGERDLELPGAVVEVKGPFGDLPQSLRTLADVGSSWTRYSKYSSSLDAHAADLGGVSRLWPSGMMHAQACMEVSKPSKGVATCGSN